MAYYDNSGVCFRTWRKVRKRPVEFVGIFDLDDTLTATRRTVHPVELETDMEFARTKGLPADFVTMVRRPTRTVAWDLHYTPIVLPFLMAQRGERFPYKPEQVLKELVIPYLRIIEARERLIEPFAGAAETMRGFKRKFPGSVRGVDTLAPTLLGVQRLHRTGILPYVNAIVGVRSECPDFLHNSVDYRQELGYVNSWMEERWRRLPVSRLRLIAGVPYRLGKPNPLASELIMSCGDATPETLVVDFDDQPRTGGMVAAVLRKGKYPRTRYVKAELGDTSPAPAGLRVDGVAKSCADYLRLCRQFESEANKACA